MNIYIHFIWIILFIFFIIHIYLQYKYGFWYYQPVVHSYDVVRMLQSPRIINPNLPSLDSPASKRFLVRNDKLIMTTIIERLTATSSPYLDAFLTLIRENYLRRKDGNVYEPSANNIWTYFVGHDHPSFISFYFDTPTPTPTPTPTIPNIIGGMTSRPLNVKFRDKDANAPDDFTTYYVEFLCVRDDKRRKGIAPRIIQTHEYYQRHTNRQIQISLFKHEDKILRGIVPLVVYKTYGFPIDKWMRKPPPRMIAPHVMLAITPQTMIDLVDFIKEQQANYRVFIYPSVANMIELIKTGNIHIHVIMNKPKIEAAYFYRKSSVRLEEGQGEVLTLVGSLFKRDLDKLDEDDVNFFMGGFYNSFYAIARKHKFGYCGIEDISANRVIVREIKKNIAPEIVSPCAYFFYNFIYPTVLPSNIFILS